VTPSPLPLGLRVCRSRDDPNDHHIHQPTACQTFPLHATDTISSASFRMSDYDPVEAMLDLTRRLPPANIAETLTSLCTAQTDFHGRLVALNASETDCRLACCYDQAPCCPTMRTTCSALSTSRSRS
jgi:hypothetical protein